MRRLHRRERPVDVQVGIPEGRRHAGQRQYGRAHVVREPVEAGERSAAQPAAEFGRALDQQHPEPGLGQRDRAAEPVRTGPHDDRVKSAARQPAIPS